MWTSHLFLMIWIAGVGLICAFLARRFRARGMTLQQGWTESLEQAAARKTAAPPAAIQPTDTHLSRVIGKLFCLAGGLSVIGCLWSLNSTIAFVRRAERVQGHIIQFRARWSANRRRNPRFNYVPRVRFLVSSGQYREIESRYSTNLPIWPPIGSPMTVLLDRKDHSQARLDSWFDLWFVPLMMLAFSCLGLVFGIFMEAGRRSARHDHFF